MPTDAAIAAPLETPARARPPREVIYRHGVVVRLTHWINVLLVSLLLMSGLNIFNAHPQLYWGAYGADFDHAWLEAVPLHPNAANSPGILRVGDLTLRTTGVLGVSKGPHGATLYQGFPSWATLPSWRDLATARRWHFFLAWLLVANGATYLLVGFFNGHFRRDMAPKPAELRPANLARSVIDHIKLKHPTGDAAKRYNILQKLAYVGVAFVVLPLIVATGLTMSPGFDAFAPWIVQLFGGRQSARSIHFICANLIVLFVIVHVVEVFLAGVVNEVLSMITGRYAVPRERHK